MNEVEAGLEAGKETLSWVEKMALRGGKHVTQVSAAIVNNPGKTMAAGALVAGGAMTASALSGDKTPDAPHKGHLFRNSAIVVGATLVGVGAGKVMLGNPEVRMKVAQALTGGSRFLADNAAKLGPSI